MGSDRQMVLSSLLTYTQWERITTPNLRENYSREEWVIYGLIKVPSLHRGINGSQEQLYVRGCPRARSARLLPTADVEIFSSGRFTWHAIGPFVIELKGLD